MSWATSNRAERLPPDWQRRRLFVLRRDGYACQVRLPNGVKCHAPANEVDHIHPGDDHDTRNLQAICTTHHRRKSAMEGVKARPTRKRAPEPHPAFSQRLERILPPPTPSRPVSVRIAPPGMYGSPTFDRFNHRDPLGPAICP